MDDEKTRLYKVLLKRFKKATADYHLLEDGDKIMIGLSGGKDSLLLLELLGRQAKIYKPKITIEACHVRMENVRYETDTSYLQALCDELGVKLHVATTRFDNTTTTNKPVCFLCSWQRRKTLFDIAQKEECNKIALGHHQDDIITTGLMNLFYQGRFDSTPPLYKMDKMPLSIIRPLCLEHEIDIKLYAELAGYEKQKKLCPYENKSQRHFANNLFLQAEAENPEVRYSIWKALQEK